MRSICTSIVATLVLAGTSLAATINVPGDYTTIQGAIDAASNGDTILVAPGVYQESGSSAVVNLNGVWVTIRGTVDPDTGEPLAIVDGQSNRVGFYCTDPASEGSVIEDIEFTNGYGGAGGAAHVRNAILTFNGCVFSNSYSFGGGSGVGEGCGGGLYTYLVSDIYLNNCVFRGNESAISGAGIFLHEVNGHLNGCLFENNQAEDDGGGLACYNCDPVINSCVIASNSAAEKGGGIAYFAGSGGSMIGCEISGNTATAGYPSSFGGGVHIAESSPLISNCVISDNSDTHAAGGLAASNSESIIENCLFTNNFGAQGAAWVHYGSPTFIDCSIVNNNGTSIGGVGMDASTPTFNGCAVVGNVGPACGGIRDISATSTASLLNTTICSNTGGQVCDNYTDLGGNTIEEVCTDTDGDGIPDGVDNCDLYNPDQADCNDNGIGDVCDIADQTSYDCNQNGIPDECESDCDGDGVIDDCDNDPDSDGDGIPDNCETDCNGNTIPDHFEIEQGWTPDCNGNGVPDECDLWDSAYDCDDNGAIDSCEIADDPGLDCDGNGTLDACDPLDDTTDCDGNGLLDICELAVDPSLDCDGSGVLDTCEIVYEYVEREKILASDGAPEENLGHGLSIEGDVAIIGARFDDDRGHHAGSAYVFKRQADGSWMEMGKLYGDDTTEEDVFGVGVSISNGRVAIGASYDDGQGGGSTGSVYIFDQQADGSWIQGDKILAPDGLIDAVFGTDVSLDGDRLLIGAPLDDDPAINVGSAFIYERNKAGQWIQQAKLQASDGDGWRYFGVGAALSGDIAMVGAPKYDGDTGVVYVFERQADGVWLETGKISASDGIGGDVFGGSIDIDGHRMMSCSNRGSGSLYVYERDNTGSWIELGNVSNPDVADGESFGYDVCLDGNQLLAGAHGAANENGVGAGEFYVMARTSELDCDANKISDFCEIEADPSLDCDSDGILDSCAIAEGLVEDCDQDGLIDTCEIADDPLLDQNNNGLLDQCECLADIAGGGEPGDGDGVVDVNDVLAIIGFWGSAGPIGDINFDGFVGVNDLLFVLNEWGPCE